MTTTSNSKAYSKTSRCWPGYEPVPGKAEHEEGSCRKKPASRNGGVEPDREVARKEQIARGGERAQQAKSKSPQRSERAAASKKKTKSGSRSARNGEIAGKSQAAKKQSSKSKKQSSKPGA
ncbi:hypothetical protein [Acidisarcina polymorpha]|uniref:hypothetical protein n=1 Tax=Acidisarcina polymorpha TaxID=2211140 RepID=UPI0012380A4D|nr:hypothetical protein [Acidisarcina polymorpha]